MLRVNTAVTAAEVIDGEAVMINLGDGMYFTMDGVGAELWLLIERGGSLEAIAGCLAARHGVDHERVLGDIAGVADELVGAGLVVVGSADDLPNDLDIDWPEPAPPYGPPQLARIRTWATCWRSTPPLPVLDPTPEP